MSHMQYIWSIATDLITQCTTDRDCTGGLSQCQINSNSKYSNCCGPRAFSGPAVRCVKFSLLYARMDIRIFRCPRKAHRNGPCILHMHAIQRHYSVKASWIFHFVWEFASAWQSISRCKLFEVCFCLLTEYTKAGHLYSCTITYNNWWVTMNLRQTEENANT